MKYLSLFCAMCISMFFSVCAAEVPRSGTNFITTEVFSEEDDAKILKAFEGLRVAEADEILSGADDGALQLSGRSLKPDTE